MIVSFRAGQRLSWAARTPRASVITGIAVAGLLLIAGCQRPTPSVTLQSGARSMHAEATAYVRDGRQVRGSTTPKVLLVRPGALVGIDVDGSIADAGWQVHITTPTGTGSTTSTQDSSTLKGQHHFAFNVGAVTTQIVISEAGSGSTPKGLWFFTLQPSLN